MRARTDEDMLWDETNTCVEGVDISTEPSSAIIGYMCCAYYVVAAQVQSISSDDPRKIDPTRKTTHSLSLIRMVYQRQRNRHVFMGKHENGTTSNVHHCCR